MRIPTTVLAGMLAIVSAAPAAAQPPPERPPIVRSQATLQELALKDGSRLYGRVESETGTVIVFRTHGGAAVTVARADVLSIKAVDGTIADGEFQRSDPNTSRLFFGPTGRAISKGQVYMGVYEFVMPFVQVGVTDRFSIGGGTPLIFSLEDDWNRPFWITPKLQVYGSDRSQFSVGVFQLLSTSGDSAGIAYGVGTFGRADTSFTIGAGLAYAGSDDRAAVLMVGGERQASRSVKFVTENYIWKGGEGIASAGVRFFGERLSADLALAMPIGASSVFVFPVVNFVYVF